MPGGVSRVFRNLDSGDDDLTGCWAPHRAPIILIPGFGAPAIGEDDRGIEDPRRGLGEARASEKGGSRRGNMGMYGYWGSAVEFGVENSPVVCVWPAGFGSMVSCGENHKQTAKVLAHAHAPCSCLKRGE